MFPPVVVGKLFSGNSKNWICKSLAKTAPLQSTNKNYMQKKSTIVQQVNTSDCPQNKCIHIHQQELRNNQLFNVA